MIQNTSHMLNIVAVSWVSWLVAHLLHQCFD